VYSLTSGAISFRLTTPSLPYFWRTCSDLQLCRSLLMSRTAELLLPCYVFWLWFKNLSVISLYAYLLLPGFRGLGGRECRWEVNLGCCDVAAWLFVADRSLICRFLEVWCFLLGVLEMLGDCSKRLDLSLLWLIYAVSGLILF